MVSNYDAIPLFLTVVWCFSLLTDSREMIEQDTVVVLGTYTGRSKKTGKTVKNEWAHVFKFSQGKAISFQEYIDTAADVLAMT